MPFVLGKGSGFKFTSETRQGVILQLKADEWNLEIADNAHHVSSIKALRDKGFEGNIPDTDDWKRYGIPREYMSGGMREAKVTVHGFFYIDATVSQAQGPDIPINNEIGKLELQYTNSNQQKVTLFKMNKATVINSKYTISVNGALEYDLEFASTDYDVDYVVKGQ